VAGIWVNSNASKKTPTLMLKLLEGIFAAVHQYWNYQKFPCTWWKYMYEKLSLCDSR